MTIVEGYSEHVMDAVVADLDEPFAQLRERMERGRDQRGWLEALLSRLLGLDVKLRQYRLGKAFCDEVAQRRGIEALNRVWSEPATLPRPSELEQPGPLAGARRLAALSTPLALVEQMIRMRESRDAACGQRQHTEHAV